MPVGKTGDCYDRYLVRVEEMRQSNKIIQQCIKWLRGHPGPVMASEVTVVPPTRDMMKNDMEALINRCKLMTEVYCTPPII